MVLLDLRLPDLDGWEVAKRIRARSAAERPYVIAVTGCGQDGDRRRSEEAGVDLQLFKPVAPKVLRGVLDRFAAVPAPAGA
jgi:DNA-binding response OmpR family regulator